MFWQQEPPEEHRPDTLQPDSEAFTKIEGNEPTDFAVGSGEKQQVSLSIGWSVAVLLQP